MAIVCPYTTGSIRSELERKYSSIMRENLRLGKYTSYRENKKVPFLRIYKYKEAFSYTLVKTLLRKFRATENDYVFDPFSGLGTTLFAATIENIPSIGIDALPLAYFISKTLPKFLLLRKNETKRIWKTLRAKIPNSKPAEIALDVPIIHKAFDKDILLLLRKIKTAIETIEEPHRDIFLFLLLSIIEECSYTSKDGQFLRIKKNKKIKHPIDALDKKVLMAEEDLIRAKLVFPTFNSEKPVLPDIYLDDAREIRKAKFKKKPTILITSPPYVNRYDYAYTYSLELCFLFVKNAEELKKLRSNLLRSYIGASIQDEEPPHPAVEEVLRALRKKKLNNALIPDMILGYFVDMTRVIEQWSRTLAPNTRVVVVVVVDNVRYEGETIPVDLILSDIAESLGFEVKEIIITRYKGNSPQQMRKYGRVPTRESILIWER